MIYPQLYMRFPQGKSRALTFSYDDGVEQDARLLSLFNQYGLKATFNLNSRMYPEEAIPFSESEPIRRMTLAAAQKLYPGSGHEIGFHGCLHSNMEFMPRNRQAREIIADREALENQFGCIVRGGAYPFGTWNENLLGALEASGVAYCRTIISTYSFQIPQNWLLLNPTCHHGDPRLMELGQRFLQDPILRHPYLFYVWGHSYEFERDRNWPVIEKFAQAMAGQEDVYYATNIQLYDYVQAYRGLRFSCDGLRVENPWAIPLWFSYLETTYRIDPGQTLLLPRFPQGW